MPEKKIKILLLRGCVLSPGKTGKAGEVVNLPAADAARILQSGRGRIAPEKAAKAKTKPKE